MIVEGTQASFDVTTVADSLDETKEEIVFTLGAAEGVRIGSRNTHRVTIADENVAPAIELSAKQTGRVMRFATLFGGEVTINTTVSDANSSDTHSYDWSHSDNSLVRSQGNAGDSSFVFNPAGLTDGYYMIRVMVTDNGSPAETTEADLMLRVMSTPMVLEAYQDSDSDGVHDADEGFGDSDNDGIEDHLDSDKLGQNILQTVIGDNRGFMMQTVPGLRVRLGTTAFASNRGAASVSNDQIIVFGNGDGKSTRFAPDSYKVAGNYYDFEVGGLPEKGLSAQIVIPLQMAIPANARYRKFHPASGWKDFVVDGNNGLASAPGEFGVCPAPGDTLYTDGLIEGHYCVQLTIQDGGPNDADGVANFIIKDPGGVTQGDSDAGGTIPVGVAVSQSGGGGGGIGYGWALILLLVTHRRKLY